MERRRLGRRCEEQRGQPVVLGADRRRVVRHAIDDAVARPQAVATTGDDVENVLGLAMRQLDLLAGRELDAAEADGDGTGRLREVGVARNVIPVRDQSGSSPSQ
ncbi:MAG: hypothetical protein AUG91_00915 [Actinobacteria bacterium 13_1_20CM_4_69_9]|nr:MAG: hypothetical protein AUG91_00915 [Actinobacteria bacterium 13_1_20CM_4_69_9]